jgi:tetratricopeptide (TPR) repeat protein/tRNA A-37 threonylcarbamoyl transferase component Bud32
VGSLVGPYKLLEAIGEGGMGTVYMAEQVEPVRRRVALKVIKPGMDSKQVVARFEAERQALAMMDHTNIAKVHDAGMTPSERPYFVMELVRGLPITDYCDQHQLSIAERLELFVLVCRAVQHAHQKGVIHRDLKPSNVLVTVIDGVGVPKVIDFGVAKATGQALTEKTLFTGFHQFVGTPLYVSPEQAELSGVDVDTRSDIYSLGVLLYELLTGTTPFDSETLKRAAFDEMRRIIREEAPLRPSTRLSTLGDRLSTVSARRKADPRRLGPSMKGELDWVVMKALEKDRRRRYETANDFAADVMRFLTDRPIEACPPSAWYRFAKLARRNRVALSTGAVLALALIAGAGVSTWQAMRAVKAEGRTSAALAVARTNFKAAEERRAEAETQRRRAEEQSAIARRAVDEMYTQVAEQWLSNVAGMTPVQIQFLEKALAYYEQFAHISADDLAGRADHARALHRVGEIRKAIGQLDLADQAHRAASDERQVLSQNFPDRPDLLADAAESLQALARIAADRGHLREAEVGARRAVSLAEAAAARAPDRYEYRDRLASCLSTLGTILKSLEIRAEAEAVDRQAVEIREELVRSRPDDVGLRRKLAGIVLNLAGVISGPLHRGGEMEVLQRRGITLLDALAREQPGQPDLRLSQADAHNDLGVTLRLTDRPGEAESEIKQAVAIYARLTEDFPQVALYRSRRALVYRHLSRLYNLLGRLDDAEAAFRETIVQSEALATQFPDQPSHREELGHAYDQFSVFLATERHRPADAVDAACRGVELFKALVRDHPDSPGYREELGGALNSLGVLLDQTRRSDEAEKSLRQSVEIYEGLIRDFPAEPRHEMHLASNLLALADLLKNTRRLAEAGPLYLRTLAIRRKDVERRPDVAELRRPLGATLNNYGLYLKDRDDLEGAVRAQEEAIEHQTRAVRGDRNDRVAPQFLRNHYANLASALDALGQPDRAAEVAERLARDLPGRPEALATAAEILDRAAARITNGPGRSTPERTRRAASLLERARGLIADAEKAGASDPKTLQILTSVLAAAENEQLRDPTRARELARRATELTPQEADPWTMLSLASARSGDWSGARMAVEKALALRAGDARDYWLQALALHHQGQGDAATLAAEAARRWVESNRVYDQPLVDQLRTEAAALIGTGVP